MINPNHQAPIHRRSVASNPKLKVVTNSSDNLQYTMHVIHYEIIFIILKATCIDSGAVVVVLNLNVFYSEKYWKGLDSRTNIYIIVIVW